MKKKEFLTSESLSLTNESVRKKFKSQFELVNYAIKLSEQMIQSGRGSLVTTECENPAVVIVKEIEEGKDKFDDTLLISKEIISEPQNLKNGVETSTNAPVKAEKKKTRRIFA